MACSFIFSKECRLLRLVHARGQQSPGCRCPAPFQRNQDVFFKGQGSVARWQVYLMTGCALHLYLGSIWIPANPDVCLCPAVVYELESSRPDILEMLSRFPGTFEILTNSSGAVVGLRVSEELKTTEERTAAVNGVFQQLRDQDAFPCLKGWRNENYAVVEIFSCKQSLFHCERAAARLLGFRQYGVHMNGYFYNDQGEVMMWIGRRSSSKQTYPGLLDNTVAGGIAAGAGVLETLVKECEEEASISPELARKAKPVGTISYCHEAEDGIEPETEFMFDLQVPPHFIPNPLDGEVSQYYCWTMDKVKVEMAADHFKPNCCLVILNFMLRHGILSPDSDPKDKLGDLKDTVSFCIIQREHCPDRSGETNDDYSALTTTPPPTHSMIHQMMEEAAACSNSV